MITNNDIKEFEGIIIAAGYSLKDFAIIPKDLTSYKPNAIPTPLKATIRMVRLSNGAEKTYKSGYLTHAHAELKLDLKSGYFDTSGSVHRSVSPDLSD